MDEETTNEQWNTSIAEIVEPSDSVRHFLLISVSVQLLCSILHAALSGAAVHYCEDTKFASYSIIEAGILIMLTLAVCFASHMNAKVLVCSVIEFTSCMICLCLVIYEAFTIKCTSATPASEVSRFCNEFRKIGNICGDSGNHDEEGDIIPHDKFKGGRIVILTAALLNLLCGIAVLVLFLLCFNADEPVYLSRKRHKSSITVGESTNGLKAFENRNQNIESNSAAANDEEQQYDKKREECESIKKPAINGQQLPISIGRSALIVEKEAQPTKLTKSADQEKLKNLQQKSVNTAKSSSVSLNK